MMLTLLWKLMPQWTGLPLRSHGTLRKFHFGSYNCQEDQFKEKLPSRWKMISKTFKISWNWSVKRNHRLPDALVGPSQVILSNAWSCLVTVRVILVLVYDPNLQMMVSIYFSLCRETRVKAWKNFAFCNAQNLCLLGHSNRAIVGKLSLGFMQLSCATYTGDSNLEMLHIVT